MTSGGVTATFEQFTQGIEKDGKRYIWIGNRRIGYFEVQEYRWTANTDLYSGELSSRYWQAGTTLPR